MLLRILKAVICFCRRLFGVLPTDSSEVRLDPTLRLVVMTSYATHEPHMPECEERFTESVRAIRALAGDGGSIAVYAHNDGASAGMLELARLTVIQLMAELPGRGVGSVSSRLFTGRRPLHDTFCGRIEMQEDFVVVIVTGPEGLAQAYELAGAEMPTSASATTHCFNYVLDDTYGHLRVAEMSRA